MTDGCAGQELLFDYPDVREFSLLICDGEGGTGTLSLDGSSGRGGFDDQVFAYDRKRQLIRFGDGIHGVVPRQKQEIYVTGLVTSLCGAGNMQAGELNRFAKEDFRIVASPIPRPLKTADPGDSAGHAGPDGAGAFEPERLAAERDYVKRVRETPGLMIEKVHVIPGRSTENCTDRSGEAMRWLWW